MKYQICGLILCLFLTNFLNAQAPSNDECVDAINLGEAPLCNPADVYTNLDATESTIPGDNFASCFNGMQVVRDVWFTFTTPADGSIVAFEISVTAVGTDGLILPQVALYRGDCEEELQELACASAEIGDDFVNLIPPNLSPGITYYLRVNEYSANATPNWGDFNLCVEEYIPDINLGEEDSTVACSGTLFDSGGPDGPYGNNENFTFTICPQESFECMFITVNDFAVEASFYGFGDALTFYGGPDTNSPQIGSLTGFGTGFELQASTSCVTVQFTSDGYTTNDGFAMEWQCSNDECTVETISCLEPVQITVPYSNTDLSTCQAGNTVTDSPCNNDGFLNGEDYIFTYESPGNECIQVNLQNYNSGTGAMILDGCPNSANNCLANSSTGNIAAANLEEPGTYYIVVANQTNCTPFDIDVTIVDCPIVFPPASSCEEALFINGCASEDGIPAVISFQQGVGDPYFINPQNMGCIFGGPLNYTFFYFQATAEGDFGFTMQAATAGEESDIDFNVWGPYESYAESCDSILVQAPIRSSYAGGADPTGLANVHPITGIDVVDEYDCNGGNNDDFVSTIPVQVGEYYVIWINDWGDNISSGNIAIDFSQSDDGVIDIDNSVDIILLDTFICAGETIQLDAGEAFNYLWTDTDDLTCTDCQMPFVTPTENSTYLVEVTTTCQTFVKVFNVGLYEADAGPDFEVCSNEDFTIDVGTNYSIATFNWTTSNGDLAWMDDPTAASPLFQIPTPGVYNYAVEVITPNCSLEDEVVITVNSNPAPEFTVTNDTLICNGASVNLGGLNFPNTTYDWSSVPAGFTSDVSNPSVMPDETTTYYVAVNNGICPITSTDSVTVSVSYSPTISVNNDTTVCQSELVTLANIEIEDDVTYAWTPEDGIDDPTNPNAVFMATASGPRVLTATRGACVVTDTIFVEVIEIAIDIPINDTLTICKGDTITLDAMVSPSTIEVNWTPSSGSISSPTGATVDIYPDIITTYYAEVNVPGCFRIDSLTVDVDSIPADMGISPLDTTICEGAFLVLQSPTYEQSDFPDIMFEWSPNTSFETPDSLYNMVLTGVDNTTYTRVGTNGVCVSIDTANVVVIPTTEIEVIPNPAEICPMFEQEVQLDVITEGVTEFEWMPEEGLSCTDCPNPIANPTATTNYIITGQFNGCPVMGDVTVFVRDPAYAFPPPFICVGESTILNSNPQDYTTYTWTSSDPNFGTSNDPAPEVMPTETTTYFLTAETAACSIMDSITIEVAFAEVSINPGDVVLCGNENVLLQAVTTGTGGGSFVWSTGQQDQDILYITNTTETVSVTYTYGNNCSVSDDIIVTHNDEASLQLPNNNFICLGDPITLNQAPNSNTTYTWTSSDPDFGTSNEAAPTVSPTVETTYSVTAVNGLCEKTGEITIMPVSETVEIQADSDYLCEGEDINLTAVNSGENVNGTFVWSTTQTDQSIDFTSSDDTEVSVTYTYGNGCIATDALAIDVIPEFSVELRLDPNLEEYGQCQPVNLSAILTGSATGATYTWQGGNLSALTGSTVLATPDVGATYYSVLVEDEFGCSAFDDTNFNLVPSEYQVPNAFTPLAEENNEFKLVSKGLVNLESFQIFNRWGQMVFETTDPDTGWDGRHKGKLAPSDVYVYLITLRLCDNQEKKILKGDVTLIR